MVRRICLSSRTPVNASSIKTLLNTRCPFQESNEIIPPQLQGNSLLKVIIAPIYIVKATINASEAYNPFSRQRGIINNNDTRNSASGNPHAINGAMGSRIGESAICSLKTAYSVSLLVPVYRKSIINNQEIISTIVDFESHDKVRIRCNEWRF